MNTVLHEALKELSRSINAGNEGKHRLSSPLGAWILLAYLSLGCNAENAPDSLTTALGMSLEDARNTLEKLIENKPEAVALALGSWSPRTDGTMKSLREASGSFALNEVKLPVQKELDEWTKKETLEIFQEFPGKVEEDTESIFASVVATDIKWETPFKIVRHDSMASAWKTETVLNRTGLQEYQNIRFFNDNAGNAFASTCYGNEDKTLTVHTVIALSETPEEAVLEASRGIALDRYGYGRTITPEQAAGYGDVVSVTKRKGVEDMLNIYLPAWKTSNHFDLTETIPAFHDAVSILTPDIESSKTMQAVKSEYDTEGFKAAAVTFTMTRASAVMPRNDVTITNIVFNRPFAVAASYGDAEGERTIAFEGWIAEAVEPTPAK